MGLQPRYGAIVMHCKSCGKEIAGESKFCRFCGEKVDAEIRPEVAEEIDYSQKESFVARTAKTTIELIVSVLILINFFSGIVGGIWLAFSGGLSLVIYGIILSIVMPWGYTLVALPQMGLAALLVNFVEKGNKFIVSIIGLVASVYGNSILALWTIFVFEALVKGQPQSFIPLILWGYSTTMAPLSYMASKEPPDSTGTSMGLLFAQLSFVLLTILFLVGGYDSARNVVLGILVFLFSSLAISVVVAGMKAQRAETRIEE